jgi:hypothetical protein
MPSPSYLATRISVIAVACVWLDWNENTGGTHRIFRVLPDILLCFHARRYPIRLFWLTVSQAHVLLGAFAHARHSTFPYFLKSLRRLCSLITLAVQLNLIEHHTTQSLRPRCGPGLYLSIHATT